MKKENTKILNLIALSDIISLMNLLSGFISILLAMNSYFTASSIAMIFSLMFDSVDGWVARKINRNDQYGFGKNIDSLSDIVSFGIAPAILLYAVSKTIPNSPEILVIIVCMVMVVCGVLRLTRYNAINDYIDFEGFIGFPIPGMSIILVSYYLSGIFNIYIALILMTTISLLMISNFRYKKAEHTAFIAIGAILLLLLILQLPLILYSVNIPSLFLLVLCLYYLLSCFFKKNK